MRKSVGKGQTANSQNSNSIGNNQVLWKLEKSTPVKINIRASASASSQLSVRPSSVGNFTTNSVSARANIFNAPQQNSQHNNRQISQPMQHEGNYRQANPSFNQQSAAASIRHRFGSLARRNKKSELFNYNALNEKSGQNRSNAYRKLYNWNNQPWAQGGSNANHYAHIMKPQHNSAIPTGQSGNISACNIVGVII